MNFNNDLKTVERFFVDLENAKLSEDDEIKIARSFYGTQGAWYMVGWQLAVVHRKDLRAREANRMYVRRATAAFDL